MIALSISWRTVGFIVAAYVGACVLFVTVCVVFDRFDNWWMRRKALRRLAAMSSPDAAEDARVNREFWRIVYAERAESQRQHPSSQ